MTHENRLSFLHCNAMNDENSIPQPLWQLAEQVRGGQKTAESAFITLFQETADRLLLHNPPVLLQLVTVLGDLPLKQPTHRQLFGFFRGVALYKTDQYQQALAVFDELLAQPDLDDLVCGRVLNSRANCCRFIGRLQEAVQGFQDSLALWQKLGNRLRQGLAWLNLGIVAYQLQTYAQAEGHLQQAISCFLESESAHWLAAAHNELGLVYRDVGRWAEAWDCFAETAVYYRSAHSQEALGRVLLNMGEVQLFQGQVAQAIATCQEALSLLNSQAYAVDVYLNLGLAHQVAGQLTEAQTAFQQALTIALQIGRRDILAEAHYRLGEVLHRMGLAEAALAELETAVHVVETTRHPLHDEGLQIGLLGRWQQIYEGLVLHCLDMNKPREAFFWAEQARARALGEQLRQNNQEVGEVGAETAVFSYFTTGVLEDVPLLQTLAAHSPVREHLLTPPYTLLFVLTANGLAVYTCPINPNHFVSQSPRDDRNRFWKTAVLRHLHTVLLASAPLPTKQLFIIPHGPLHRIPFAALESSSGQPLNHTNNPTLAYAPSVTLLHTPTFPKHPTETILAVGYNGTHLRHTETEAQLVADLLNGTAWVGSHPKKELLQQATSRYRWLHVACHGRFDEETPMASYLQTGQDERLTAQKIMDSWQLQAECVVLSACQSGVSRVLRGDEPMGLIRAFLYAGARAVVASQWAVEDLPTFLLMRQFYQWVQQGDEIARALQKAQGWLRQATVADVITSIPQSSVFEGQALYTLPSTSKPFTHPHIWAAFNVWQRGGGP